jgi:signal transduction histidine kinase/CheY-like chemotaxis protein
MNPRDVDADMLASYFSSVPEAFRRSWILIEWLCSSLGLPLIEERYEGGLRLNGAARDVLGAGAHTNMLSALGPLLSEQLDQDSLEESLHKARQGEAIELTLVDGLRALASQAGPGLAYVVLAPAGALDAVALQRRALATDRSARVSHELANALGAIAGWARLAKEGARVDEALDLIEKSADDAWSAARTVLGEVSGQQENPAEDSVIDLSEFTGEAARLLIPKALKKAVEIHTEISPALHIAGDRSSAWAIVWNLATNAVEALPAGGKVTLQLTEANGRVLLSVSDDGPGMSAEVRARVFEPYFTTKRSGSGLGLPMVKQAVAALGGHIELVSQPGSGTRFTIDLPRSESSITATRQLRAAPRRPSGVFVTEHLEGRFLVIDDDASLREMIGTALRMRGAVVELAANLSDALKLQGPFKLAVVDYLLGEQRGDVALARLRAAGLVETGLLVTGTEVPRKLVAGGEPDGVLRKPFELNELFERVAELIQPGRVRQSAAS